MNNRTKNVTNSTIRCTVENCAYQNESYCSLNQIQVGPCSNSVTACTETQCASFQLGNAGGLR